MDTGHQVGILYGAQVYHCILVPFVVSVPIGKLSIFRHIDAAVTVGEQPYANTYVPFGVVSLAIRRDVYLGWRRVI